MLKVKEINKQTIIDFYAKDPNLCWVALPDNDLIRMYDYLQNGTPYILPPSNYLGVYNEEDKLVCVFKYELMTELTIDYHIYVASDMHDKGITIPLRDAMVDWFKNNTKITKAVIHAPKACGHANMICLKIGMKKLGEITDAIIWRQKLTNLVIYTMDIYDENRVDNR